jgi:hypothetical protein
VGDETKQRETRMPADAYSTMHPLDSVKHPLSLFLPSLARQRGREKHVWPHIFWPSFSTFIRASCRNNILISRNTGGRRGKKTARVFDLGYRGTRAFNRGSTLDRRRDQLLPLVSPRPERLRRALHSVVILRVVKRASHVLSMSSSRVL